MANTIIDVNDAAFEAEVVNQQGPVLVDFWAEWCGPCKAMTPILHEVADEYADSLKVVKVDVDENEATAKKVGIRNLPALMLYKNGEVVASQSGGLTKAQMLEFVAGNL